MDGFGAIIALLSFFLVTILNGTDLFLSRLRHRRVTVDESNALIDGLLYESNYRAAAVDCTVDGRIRCFADADCAVKCLPSARRSYCDAGTGRCAPASPPVNQASERDVEALSCPENRGLVRVLYRRADGDHWGCAGYTSAIDHKGRVRDWICDGGRSSGLSVSFTGRVKCTCAGGGTPVVFSKDTVVCVVNPDLVV